MVAVRCSRSGWGSGGYNVVECTPESAGENRGTGVAIVGMIPVFSKKGLPLNLSNSMGIVVSFQATGTALLFLGGDLSVELTMFRSETEVNDD